MAWSWSHSGEAYAAVERQINDMAERAASGCGESRDWLLVVTAEWAMQDISCPYDKWLALYKRAMRKAWRSVQAAPDVGLGYQNLADAIWQKASDLATCDNGGWNAWVCPVGCHTLPFTHPDEADCECAK